MCDQPSHVRRCHKSLNDIGRFGNVLAWKDSTVFFFSKEISFGQAYQKAEQGVVVEVKVGTWKTIRTNRAGQGQGQELSGEKGGNEEDEEAIRGLEHLPLQLSPHSENQDSFPF